ncbi:MAG: ABC transporter permease [Burkholderiales bacterium]
MILPLALRSLANRKVTAGLTVLSIALAVLLLLGVERIRHEARESFASAVSGTDLIVGARTSPVHLLLAAVFHVGNVTHNLRWDTFLAVSRRAEIAWTVPLSLGDSHRGFRVVGTTPAYFEHYRFADARALTFQAGRALAGPGDCVLGAQVAAKTRYHLGDRVVLAHGAGDIAFTEHADHPLTVTGILEPTGTPVDRVIHVTLEALDAVHAAAGAAIDPDPLAAALKAASAQTAAERTLTAMLVGLRHRPAALAMQRTLNDFAGDPLTAILPAVALQEVWEITSVVEHVLLAVSALVVVVGLGGMLIALLTGLGERRREMAILRSVGARPAHVFALLLGEAVVLTLTGVALGGLMLHAGLALAQPWVAEHWGFVIRAGAPSVRELALAGLVACAGLLVGLVPAYRLYRTSLADGMTVRL